MAHVQITPVRNVLQHTTRAHAPALASHPGKCSGKCADNAHRVRYFARTRNASTIRPYEQLRSPRDPRHWNMRTQIHRRTHPPSRIRPLGVSSAGQGAFTPSRRAAHSGCLFFLAFWRGVSSLTPLIVMSAPASTDRRRHS